MKPQKLEISLSSEDILIEGLDGSIGNLDFLQSGQSPKCIFGQLLDVAVRK